MSRGFVALRSECLWILHEIFGRVSRYLLAGDRPTGRANEVQGSWVPRAGARSTAMNSRRCLSRFTPNRGFSHSSLRDAGRWPIGHTTSVRVWDDVAQHSFTPSFANRPKGTATADSPERPNSIPSGGRAARRSDAALIC